jgi:hypothetical protein
MQEPEPHSSQDPHEEIELLREKLRRLEAEHAEVQQALFDHYEWTREKTKAFGEELRSLRNISLEYQLLDFLRGIYQRTTGLPRRTLEEEVEKVKISLVAIPGKNDPNRDEWLRSFLRQTHANFDLTVVLSASDPEVSQDILDHTNVRVVRADDTYSDAIRANIGLCWASGDIHGFVVSGYWPYERSIENVARFFTDRADSQVMAPLDFSIVQGLFAATEVPGHSDFLAVWNDYAARHGSLFFRPKAYKKLGRIIYEVGEPWILATLLQLAWYFTIGRPDSLIFVNGSTDNSELRSARESINREARDRFYVRNTFGDYEKPIWYFPFPHTTRGVRLARRAIDQVLLRIRGWILQPIRSGFLSLRARLTSRAIPHLFPIAATGSDFGASDKIDLSGVERCPLTERLPDRLLFSLQPFGEKSLADVFYSTETSVAIISRGRPEEEDFPGGLESGLNASRELDELDWRFVRPIVLEPPVAADGQPVDPIEKGDAIPMALDKVVAEVLDGEKISDALWIGDSRFSPSAGSLVDFSEKRLWNDCPGLLSADLAALRESNILAGRTTETGFNLIHLAGVIHFCRQPRRLLRFLAFALRYQRYLLISTPNLDSSELRQFGPAWCHWEPGLTRFVYGVNSLRGLMRHCGFEEKKLVTFSHPAWKLASHRNVANGIPTQGDSSQAGFASLARQHRKARTRGDSLRLQGDYLIGLFARRV